MRRITRTVCYDFNVASIYHPRQHIDILVRESDLPRSNSLQMKIFYLIVAWWMMNDVFSFGALWRDALLLTSSFRFYLRTITISIVRAFCCSVRSAVIKFLFVSLIKMIIIIMTPHNPPKINEVQSTGWNYTGNIFNSLWLWFVVRHLVDLCRGVNFSLFLIRSPLV